MLESLYIKTFYFYYLLIQTTSAELSQLMPSVTQKVNCLKMGNCRMKISGHSVNKDTRWHSGTPGF